MKTVYVILESDQEHKYHITKICSNRHDAEILVAGWTQNDMDMGFPYYDYMIEEHNID